jgi:hypothetical protein
VKIWVGFLLVTLFLAARSVRKQQPGRDIVLLGGCFVIAVLLSTYRFV